MDICTRQDLLDLKTRDRKLRDLKQIQNYVNAMYYSVKEEARFGNQRYITFWIADAYQANRYILHRIEYFYPWHSKSIRKSDNPLKNYFMRRPIPEEIYEPIVKQLRTLFPDCDIHLEHDPIPLLVIRW
jgi:hypothetical protein